MTMTDTEKLHADNVNELIVAKEIIAKLENAMQEFVEDFGYTKFVSSTLGLLVSLTVDDFVQLLNMVSSSDIELLGNHTQPTEPPVKISRPSEINY